MEHSGESERLFKLETDFRDELEAVISKDKYSDLSCYAVLGAIEVLKSELMEYICLTTGSQRKKTGAGV